MRDLGLKFKITTFERRNAFGKAAIAEI